MVNDALTRIENGEFFLEPSKEQGLVAHLLAAELFRGAAVQIREPALRDAFRKRYPETRPSGAGRK